MSIWRESSRHLWNAQSRRKGLGYIKNLKIKMKNECLRNIIDKEEEQNNIIRRK